ncbi:unnamed protein product [marine sediment metagenome]|uniref:Integrase catalytic domain-containing protein n=1 Tax=marine sediment metagenome TaxID=412755 RepID=X1VRJ4_9ZZZZ
MQLNIQGCLWASAPGVPAYGIWRSVKYEEVYMKDYQTPEEAYRGLEGYFEFYNTERLHQALNYGTPQEAYQQGAGKYHYENAEHHLISA